MVDTLLTEGLIAVPPKIKLAFMRFSLTNILWMLRDKTSAKKYPQHRKAILQAAKDLAIPLPPTKFTAPDDHIAKKMLMDFSGMPANYQHLKPAFGALWLVSNFDPKISGDGVAFWRERTAKLNSGEIERQGMLVLQVHNLRGVREFPERRQPEEVRFVASFIEGAVDHELRHLVQAVLIAAKDPHQVKTLPDYKKHGTDYYASPIEFDPQIGDSVRDFMEFYRILNGYFKDGSIRQAPDLKSLIKQHLGLAKSRINGMQTDKVFAELRRAGDQDVYRRAVKKFLIALNAELAEDHPESAK